MESVYEEVQLEAMEFVEDEQTYYFSCPCGDKFQITLEDLLDGEDIARCPSCSLVIRVLYDIDALEVVEEEEEEEKKEEKKEGEALEEEEERVVAERDLQPESEAVAC